MPICPQCGERVESLDYSAETTGTEWGSERFPLYEGNMETEETEINNTNNVVYICPECNEELTTEEIRRMQQEAINEINEEPPQRRNERNNSQNQRRACIINSKYEPLECPHCKHIYEDEEQEEQICPRCNKTWSNKETTENITNHQEQHELINFLDQLSNQEWMLENEQSQYIPYIPQYIQADWGVRLNGIDESQNTHILLDDTENQL